MIERTKHKEVLKKIEPVVVITGSRQVGKSTLCKMLVKNENFNNNGVSAKFYYYRDTNQHEIDLIVKDNGKLNLIECKSGVMCNSSDIKSFDQLRDTAFEISGSGIICNTDKVYALKPGFYAVPIKSL